MKRFLIKMELIELKEDDFSLLEEFSKKSDLWFKLKTDKGSAVNFFKTEEENALEILPKIIGESFSMLYETIEEGTREDNLCQTKIS